MIKKNAIANFSGQIFLAVISLAFVPVYIKFLGIEAYGLVGFFALVTNLLVILDAGFSSALTRELAKTAHIQRELDSKQQSLINSLELVFWIGSAVIGLIFWLFSPWVATVWLSAQQMATAELINALKLMGVALIAYFPLSLYAGCFLGMQRQVELNVIQCSLGVLRSVGAALILWKVAPTIEAFFIWQIFIGAISAFLFRVQLYRFTKNRLSWPSFNLSYLRQISRYALSVGGTNVLALVLTQVDKLIVSGIFSLSMFAIYSLAWTIASILYRISSPIYNAIYPNLVQLVANDEQQALLKLFYKSSIWMTAVLLPFSLVIIFFPAEVAWVWTGNVNVAKEIKYVLPLFMIGTLLNGFMHIPYGIQLAYGWTRFGLMQNLIAVILMGPLLIIFSHHFGLIGASMVWSLVNGFFLLSMIWFFFKKYFVEERLKWVVQVILRPVLLCLFLISIAKIIILEFGFTSRLYMFIALASIYISVQLILLLSLKETRDIPLKTLKKAFNW